MSTFCISLFKKIEDIYYLSVSPITTLLRDEFYNTIYILRL